jgi:hypothetical protein
MPLDINKNRAALVIAHPSHELRVYGWLERAHPRVFVLTDGSGRCGQPRLGATTRLLAQLGIETGCIYGRLTDIEIYSAILKKDFELFNGLADELAEAFSRDQVDYVVGDAVEGYNSAHDVCRLLVGAAVEMANSGTDRRISNFEFLVIGRPDLCPEPVRSDAIWLQLDEGAFARKLRAARACSAKLSAEIDAALGGQLFEGKNRFAEPDVVAEIEAGRSGIEELRSDPELAAQLNSAIGGLSIEKFRVECLRPIDNRAGCDSLRDGPPFYEMYGQKLVAAGRYDQVIRYREHIVPIAEALWSHVANHT